MRFLLICLSLITITSCGTGLKKAAPVCEEKLYFGCPVGKMECNTDANGCKQCQCVVK